MCVCVCVCVYIYIYIYIFIYIFMYYQLFMDGFLLQSDTSGISGSETELMQGNNHIKILLRCL